MKMTLYHRCTQGGAPYVPPQKTLKNCNIKMQLNTKIEDPLPDFLTTPCTPSKEFEKDCASMLCIYLVDTLSVFVRLC